MSAGRSSPGLPLALLGAALQLPLWSGWLGAGNLVHTILDSGLGDLSTLGPALEEVFAVSLPGGIVGGAGLALLTLALVGVRYRAPWFFWFLIFDAVLLLPLLPAGTAAGVFFLGYCLWKRREFSGGNVPPSIPS